VGGRLQLAEGDKPVKGVVLPHGGDERPAEVDAHFPGHPLAAAPGGKAGETGVSRLRQFQRPDVAGRLARDPAHAIEGVHPFGQVVVVLAIPLPLHPFVEGLSRPALVQFLADPQPADRRVPPSLLLVEAADPAGARVVVAVPAEDGVYLVDQAQGEVPEFFIVRPAIELQ
jgi:hypothetical protein